MITTVFLIGSSPALTKAVQAALEDISKDTFSLETAACLAEANERLKAPGIEAILTHLGLPDSEGIATLENLVRAVPHIPILVLAGGESEQLAREVLDRGAQDYLLTGAHLNSYTLGRALRGAIGRKRAEDSLFIEKERAQVTLNSIGDAVLSTDMQHHVTYLNVVAEKMTGWSNAEAAGKPLEEVFRVIDGATRLPTHNPMEVAIREGRTVELPINTVLIRRDGVESPIEDSAAPIHDRQGAVTGAVIVFHDVGDARALALKMSHMAQHDHLTHLPNRMLLEDRLAHSIALAQRHGKQLAVLFVDLDHFKTINDSMGHALGDHLLTEIAKRLVSCVRHSDTVCRQGGDEFVVLLSELDRAEHALIAATKIRAALLQPCTFANHTVHVSASIGISVYPDDGQDANTLLKCADAAMYHAKNSGRNNQQFFRQTMNVRAVDRQLIEEDLRRALDRQQFVLHYQPTAILKTGAISGAEALIRWQHPERGMLLPAAFIPMAEKCGLIELIDRWVLRQACVQARAWLAAGLNFQRMSVNLSSVILRNPGCLDAVSAALRRARLDPSCLEVELTEPVQPRNVEVTSSVLQALSAKGVRIAIDNFGLGYSSLGHLRRFPIDTIKIDRSLVRNIVTDAADASIVSAIIAMGQSLKIRVAVAGIESKEQLGLVQSYGCLEGQGYALGHPLSAQSFTALLETKVPSSAAHGPRYAGRAQRAR